MEELLKLAQQMEVQQLLMFIAFYWLMSRKIDAKISKVEDKIDKLGDRVDRLSDRVTAVESRVARIEGMMMNKECCLLTADEKKKAL